ncbi:hypothetical protein ACSS6W_008442 [Trichoderma asperelloides]
MKVKSRTGSCVETIAMTRTNTLLDQALEKTIKIQSTGKNVQPSQDLHEVMTQLSKAKDYLSAIKNISGLQNHDFSAEIEAAAAVLQECESLFNKLPGNSMKPSQISLEYVRYEKQLKPMQGHLDKALQQISSRVLDAPVGVKGDLVELSVLNDTNAKVGLIFKKSLALMDFLKEEGMLDGKGLNETISLEPAKFEAFKFSASQKSSSGKTSQTPRTENNTVEGFTRAIIQDNTAGDNMKTFTGNIGFDSGYKSSYTGTSKFLRNKIGNDGALFTGDIGGQAAVEMMKGMWGGK